MTSALQAVPPARPRAVLYVRVSTKEQLQGEGDPDGYSIPAQREVCTKRAAALGADVVEAFVERGESARSADRPELQRMLEYLRTEPVDYVIVHKIDRLARNRMDDVTISAQIQAAGAQLVSVTENIDETPSGLLMHGIMSSIAEFYSRNLAAEVIKGTEQKVAAGGTPHVAPLGYLNVRTIVDGRELRTVALDPERAELVRWAFTAYATGDYSLRTLAEALTERGLTQRATAKRPTRRIVQNKVYGLLRNRYYLGLVTWRGVEHAGNHPALVDATTFAEVQRLLSARRVSGERSYRHQHYLAGTVFCGRCQSRLLFAVAKGRLGDSYDYLFCAGRHSGRTNCDLPYLPADQVEAAVTRHWQTERFPDELTNQLRSELVASLASLQTDQASERQRLSERVAATRRERYKWADLAMDGSVPSDIAREKQQQLSDQLLSAESALERITNVEQTHEDLLRSLLSLIDRCDEAYKRSDKAGRRDYNQAWFRRLDIDCDDDTTPVVSHVDHTPLLGALQAQRAADGFRDAVQDEKRRRSVSSDGVHHVDVSNFELLVELRGFEPLTSSMPWRRATNCAKAPNDHRRYP